MQRKIKKGWIYKTDIEGKKTEEMFFNGDLYESISISTTGFIES